MRDSLYQHSCCVLMGVATVFRLTGYNMASFISVSLVHSAHVRDPTAIIDHAGYYGQSVKEISSCVSTLLVPLVLNYLQPKWALVIGSGIFAFYCAGFFYINNFLFFFSSGLLGVAYVLSYTAYQMYQMQFSTRKTLARNATLVWGIAGFSLIFGGCLYMYVTATHDFSKEGNAKYRYYSLTETRTICGFLFGSCVIALVLHALFPNRQVKHSVTSENPNEKLTLSEQFKAIASVLVHPHILIFIPRFLNTGVFFSFYMNVYPTSFQFSTILSKNHPMLTAYYAFAMCAGNCFCGLVVSPLNRRIHDFGLRPLYYITIAIQLLAYTIATLTVPNVSTNRPTSESAFIEPHVAWVCVMAFLMGVGDSTNTASNVVLSSRLIPGRASHTFSAGRFYISAARSMIFFCSPLLTMHSHAVLLFTTALVSAITFEFAVKRVEQREAECGIKNAVKPENKDIEIKAWNESSDKI